MLFYCSEHMQKRESNICELDTCSFLRFSLPTNTEPRKVRRLVLSAVTNGLTRRSNQDPLSARIAGELSRSSRPANGGLAG